MGQLYFPAQGHDIKNVLPDLRVLWVERTLDYWTGVTQSQRERLESAG